MYKELIRHTNIKLIEGATRAAEKFTTMEFKPKPPVRRVSEDKMNH
jgi:hypothetical protein